MLKLDIALLELTATLLGFLKPCLPVCYLVELKMSLLARDTLSSGFESRS
jgi:hypothetical protein